MKVLDFGLAKLGEISQLAVSPDRRHFAFAFVGVADSDLVELRFATARSE